MQPQLCFTLISLVYIVSPTCGRDEASYTTMLVYICPIHSHYNICNNDHVYKAVVVSLDRGNAQKINISIWMISHIESGQILPFTNL